jgi:hypothetical protein
MLGSGPLIFGLISRLLSKRGPRWGSAWAGQERETGAGLECGERWLVVGGAMGCGWPRVAEGCNVKGDVPEYMLLTLFPVPDRRRQRILCAAGHLKAVFKAFWTRPEGRTL